MRSACALSHMGLTDYIALQARPSLEMGLRD
jgi:hypothetical protein